MARAARYEVLGTLPPGGPVGAQLGLMHGPGGWRRPVVLRPAVGAPSAAAPAHPRLLAPFAYQELDGIEHAVFAFVAGVTLREVVAEYRAQSQLPPLGLMVRAVADAARVLHAAYTQVDPLDGPRWYVHGALNDRRVFFGFDGEVRVIDVGARAKNRFDAPELTRAAPDVRSDVFSLAATLHSALTGFERNYAQVLAKAPSSAEFPPPSAVNPEANRQLDAVVMRAVFPDREGRLGSMLELADDLERVVDAVLPKPDAVAVRLKQLFETRLEQLRAMLPPVDAPAAPALVPPRPSPRAPRRSPSSPRVPLLLSADPAPPPVPHELVLPSVAERRELGDDEERTQVQAIPTSIMRAARPTGEQLQLHVDASRKAAMPIEEEPTNIGLPATVFATPVSEGVLYGTEPVATADVPTSPPRRVSAEVQSVIVAQSAEDRQRALGQELVQTGQVPAVTGGEPLADGSPPSTAKRLSPRLSGEFAQVHPVEPLPPRSRAPRVIIAVPMALLVVGAGLAALSPGLLARLRGASPAPLAVLPQPAPTLDAGEGEEEAAQGVAPAATTDKPGSEAGVQAAIIEGEPETDGGSKLAAAAGPGELDGGKPKKPERKKKPHRRAR